MKPDQQQFKIRMSVSTKMVFLITALLIIPIFFLNISAITLFQKDKKAYVYDSQTTLAVLAGREFVSYLEHSMGTLKLILGSIDLHRLSGEAKNFIQFYLDNQTALIGVDLYTIRAKDWVPTQVYRKFLPSLLQDLHVEKDDDIKIDLQVFEEQRKRLEETGFYFQNISKTGLPPLLAIIFADPSRVDQTGEVQVAVGYANLKYFISGMSQSVNKVVIASREGRLLFHSDAKNLYSNMSLLKDGVFEEAWGTAATSGAKEYLSNQGIHTLGSYYKPGLDLVVFSQIDYNKAMRATYTLTEKFIILGLAALGFMVVLGLIFSKSISSPLKRLFLATNQVSSGNFDVRMPITSRDEFGALTNAFLAMSHKISDLIQEMVDKVRVDQELAIAKTVQQSLFPPIHIDNEHLILDSHYQSASECGGDWWGYFRIGNKHSLIIADATGHGLPSALMTASCRSCFSVIEKLATDANYALNPADMLAIANRVVYDSAQGKIMMTCFAGVIDFDKHEITFASAGHNPPWVFSRNGSEIKSASLVANGQRLGEVQTIQQPYEVKTASFQSQDTIVFYTDGLIEGKDKAGEQYGKKRARQNLEENIVQDPQTIINNLMVDFLSHNAGKALDDDVTLAVMRILI